MAAEFVWGTESLRCLRDKIGSPRYSCFLNLGSRERLRPVSVGNRGSGNHRVSSPSFLAR